MLQEVESASRPNLVLIVKPRIMQRLRDGRKPALDSLKDQIFDVMAEGFRDLGCGTTRLADADDKKGKRTPPISARTHGVIVNPVYTDDLHPEARRVLSSIDPTETERQQSFIDRRDTLVEYLPEITPTLTEPLPIPFLRTVGSKVQRNLEIEHPYYLNMVLRGDEDGLIAAMAENFAPHFGWMGMVKFGSTVLLDVPYKYLNGHTRAESARLYTLEGGNIFIPFEELAGELVPRASTTDLPKSKEDTSLTIPAYVWKKSPVVEALRMFAEFAGQRGLVRPQVLVAEYGRGGLLKRVVRKVAGYGIQAEAAFYGFDDGLFIPGFSDHPGVAVITRSGKWGTVKTNIQPADLNAAKPTEDFGNVVSIGMAGVEFQGSSVEAIELVNTQQKLIAKDPQRFGISKDYVRTQPIIFQLHLHNLLDARYLPQGIFPIPWDFRNHPVGSCGKDSMMHLLEYATVNGIDKWKERGMVDRIAFCYLPDHGQVIFVFRTPTESPSEVMSDALRLLDKATIIRTPMVRLALAKDPSNYPELAIAA